MNPPVCIRTSLANHPLWYDTNIPIPDANDELEFMYKYWKNRWMHIKQSDKHPANMSLWIHYRMIYSRYMELNDEMFHRFAQQ